MKSADSVQALETDLGVGRYNMKSVIEMPIWVIGLIGITAAAWQLMAFLGAKDPQTGIPDMMAGLNHLWWAIGAVIIATLCVVIYFVRHPRVEEEIHISR